MFITHRIIYLKCTKHFITVVVVQGIDSKCGSNIDFLQIIIQAYTCT